MLLRRTEIEKELFDDLIELMKSNNGALFTKKDILARLYDQKEIYMDISEDK